MKPNKRKPYKLEKVTDMIRAILNAEFGNLEDEKELELLKIYTLVAINKILEKEPKYTLYEFHYVIILVGGYSVEGFVDIKMQKGKDKFEAVGLNFINVELLSKKDRLKTEPGTMEIQLFCILSKKLKQRAPKRRFGIGVYLN